MSVSLPALFLEFFTAIADGRIDAAEATSLIESLAELVPTEDLAERAGGWVEDLLYRDDEELTDAIARKEVKLAEARAEGDFKRIDRLEGTIAKLRGKLSPDAP